jgi:dTDP-4-amino-4,6-dideoxygalactose transaminase
LDFSFPASANVIEDLSAIPVFADVDPFTFNMLPEELEQKITDRTRAVMFVDAFGNPTGIGRIREICRAAGLTLIEDAACAIGSSFHGIRCGAISDLTCFSFHPRKLLTTGEGGAILTGDEAFSSTLDVILNHGAVPRGMEYNFVECGYNFRLPELQAIMGIKQLKKLDSIVKSRTQIRNVCAGRLADLGFTAQSVGEGVVHNVQSLVFVVPEGVDRDRLVVSLKERGIESTIGTYCLSGTTYYRSRYRNVLPNSQMLFEKTITLPCYEGVDTDFICDEIAGIVKHGAGRDHQKSVNP